MITAIVSRTCDKESGPTLPNRVIDSDKVRVRTFTGEVECHVVGAARQIKIASSYEASVGREQ